MRNHMKSNWSNKKKRFREHHGGMDIYGTGTAYIYEYKYIINVYIYNIQIETGKHTSEFPNSFRQIKTNNWLSLSG